MADLLLKLDQEGESEALLQDMRGANRQSVRAHYDCTMYTAAPVVASLSVWQVKPSCIQVDHTCHDCTNHINQAA